MKTRQCGYCHQRISPEVHPYTMRIELFPRVADTLEIRPEDLELDFDTEMKALIAQLESMSPDEIDQEEERIYTRFCFILCPSCRDSLVKRFGESEHVPEP